MSGTAPRAKAPPERPPALAHVKMVGLIRPAFASIARRLMRTFIALSFGMLLVLSLASKARAAELGSDLEVSIVTMGPGDHPFLKFGHNAIWIRNKRTAESRIYNFGTFHFSSPNLIADFLKGRLQYWLSVQSRRALEDYREQRRSLYVQHLDLTPSQRHVLSTALARNARPEHRAYKYDYYLDNCSTRVRDVIDRISSGRIRAAASEPAKLTYRGHTLRLVADDVPLYLGLHLVLGHGADRLITRWDEMFLPEKFREGLRAVTVTQAGVEVPLVSREQTLYLAEREAPLDEPPNWLFYGALVGAALGGLLATCGHKAREWRAARLGFGSLLAVLGLVFGFLGCVFVMFWVYTDHQVAHRNENILQCAPFVLALAVSAPLAARGSFCATRFTLAICASGLVASALGLILKLVPGFIQDNVLIIAIALPVWAGATLGSYWLRQAAAKAKDHAGQHSATRPEPVLDS